MTKHLGPETICILAGLLLAAALLGVGTSYGDPDLPLMPEPRFQDRNELAKEFMAAAIASGRDFEPRLLVQNSYMLADWFVATAKRNGQVPPPPLVPQCAGPAGCQFQGNSK